MPSCRLRPLIKILHSLSFVIATRAFTFAYTPPTQCDPLTISWQGGQPPFEILLVPAFDSPRNFSVPSVPNNGSLTLQLPLSAGQQFLIALSDASGFGSGGVSDILTVGSSITRTACSTQVPALKYTFSLDPTLQQCAPFTVSGYTDAVQPVTMTGLVPLGTPVQIPLTIGPTSFVWNPADISAGTSVVFFLTDSQGNFGGSSHLINVAASANSQCINAQSPHSTADATSGGPTAIAHTSQGTGSSTTASAQATVTVTPGRGINPAAIGGAVAGGLVAILILATLSAFFFRTYLPSKRVHSRFSQRYSVNGTQRGPMPPDDYITGNPLNRFPPTAPFGTTAYQSTGDHSGQWTTFSSSAIDNSYITEPFEGPAYATPLSHSHSMHESTQQTTNSAWSSKSATGPLPQRPTRFILHTDAEEEIELPPQYSDRLQRSAPPTKPL